MPIVLVDFSVEDGWEGDMDARRRIEWTFNFDLQTYFYGVQTDKKIITKTITDTFDDLDSTVPATTVESTSLGDTFTYRTD